MEVDTETVQTKSIEEIEAEFKWNASTRVQLSDVISEFRNPYTVLANAQKMATIVAIDLSEANQSDQDVRLLCHVKREKKKKKKKLTYS
jgi:hypothetical protein